MTAEEAAIGVCLSPVPADTDLAVFPELVGSKLKHHMHFWKANLARVCRRDSSAKQRLLSALIMVIHEPGCEF